MENSSGVNKKIRIVGLHVAAARKLLRMSQADLAAVSGISEAAIKKFEVGLHKPRPRTLEALRAALETRGIEFTNGDSPGVKLNSQGANTPKSVGS